MYYRNSAPYLGLNLCCMALGLFIMLASWNPIAGILAYLASLATGMFLTEFLKEIKK